jgi:hypothetical protein
VIAGAYYSNNPYSSIQLIMPTATASNDYMMIEYSISQPASLVYYGGQLIVNFPSSNTFYQNQATLVSYVWDSNSSYWMVTEFRTSATSYIA